MNDINEIETIFKDYKQLQLKKEKLLSKLNLLNEYTGVRSPKIDYSVNGNKRSWLDIINEKDKITDELLIVELSLLEIESSLISLSPFEIQLLFDWFNSDYKKSVEHSYIEKGYSRRTVYRKRNRAINKLLSIK